MLLLVAALAGLAPGCVFNRRVRGPVDAATAERIRELFDGRKVVVTLRIGDRAPHVVKGLAQFDDGHPGRFAVVQSEQSQRVNVAEIKELRTSRRGEAIAWGTFAGSVAGVAVGALAGRLTARCTYPHQAPATCADRRYEMLVGAISGGGVGAAAGFVVGSIIGRGPVWRFD